MHELAAIHFVHDFLLSFSENSFVRHKYSTQQVCAEVLRNYIRCNMHRDVKNCSFQSRSVSYTIYAITNTYVTKQICIDILNHVEARGVAVRGVEWVWFTLA